MKKTFTFLLVVIITGIGLPLKSIAQTCPSGLIGYWKMDETTDATLVDMIGANNATRNSSTGQVSGKIGNSQRFTYSVNGSNDGYTDMEYAEASHTSAYNFPANSSFTISYWIKFRDCGYGFQDHIAISKGDWNGGGGQADGMFASGLNGSCKINFLLRDNTGYKVDLERNYSYADETWHHVACVRDEASEKNILYVDGQVADEAIYNYSGGFGTTMNLQFGNLVNYGSHRFILKGDMDEVAIFNRALSSTEINTIITNAGSGIGICQPNNNPAFTSSPVTTATEDLAYTYNIAFNDADVSDALTLTAPTKPSWLNLNFTAGQKTASLTGTPNYQHVGSNSIVLRVSDGHTTVDQSFSIAVSGVTYQPVITSTPAKTIGTDLAYIYTLTVTDADVEDIITMDEIKLPSWLAFSYTPGSKTATISGTPGKTDVGDDSVKISISDGKYTIFEKYKITVTPSVNPPVITGQSTLTINEGNSITIQKSDLIITDPDDPINDISIKVKPGNNYSFTENTVTPTANFSGQLTVNVVAYIETDTSSVFPLIVNIIPVQEPPVFTSTPVLIASVGEPYLYHVDATDADEDDLIFSGQLVPSWLSFDSDEKTLSGIPGNDDLGQHKVIIQVTDNIFNIQQTFYVNVVGTLISERSKSDLLIYPSPVKNEMKINFNKSDKDATLELINLTGHTVKMFTIPAGTEFFSITTDDINDGLYFIRFNSIAVTMVQKIVIAK